MIIVNDNITNGGIYRATDEELDALKQVLPYHVYITRESVRSDVDKLSEWCLSLKHRWNFIHSSDEKFLFMFARSRDAVLFALKFV
jgi:hypothetical protein